MKKKKIILKSIIISVTFILMISGNSSVIGSLNYGKTSFILTLDDSKCSNKIFDDTITVPDDFTSIQEAIDHAHEYSTIFVKSGIYNEELLINVNAIQLIGEDLNNTIICGSQDEPVIRLTSFFTSITGFCIQNGSIGIAITEDTPTFNTIYGNVITKNAIGIKIENAPRSNVFYHNNFIDNNVHAFDSTVSNSWYYDKEISHGNYWDDYQGIDVDNDGIGDTAYLVAGGNNQDEFPLMNPYQYYPPPEKPTKPTGPSKGKPDVEYTFTVSTTDPNNENIYYWFDWGDETTSHWIDPVKSGEQCSCSHTWDEKSMMNIRVKAKNEKGSISVWSDPLTMQLRKNKDSDSYFVDTMKEFDNPFQKRICKIIDFYLKLVETFVFTSFN